jgi:predicted GNAT family acetyltransferase
VALAGITRQVAGVARVAPVYTPPEHRGRGYGAAATAAVSRQALDEGAADVVLYTDLDNAATNRLYARLGYVPVEDRLVLALDA